MWWRPTASFAGEAPNVCNPRDAFEVLLVLLTVVAFEPAVCEEATP